MVLFLVLGAAALAIDAAHARYVKVQLDAAVDSAALAAASGLPAGQSEARRRAKAYAARNIVAGQPVLLSDGDIDIGVWDSLTRTFTSGGAHGTAMAIRVRANRQVNYGFGRILGIPEGQVVSTGTGVFRSRDIVLVLDYSASMNDDSELTHVQRLGLYAIRKNLQEIWMDLGSPQYGRMTFDPVLITSTSTSTILSQLGLTNVPYPYPSGNWTTYVNYVKNDSVLQQTGFAKRYGYLTLINYWLAEMPMADETPDLWKTHEQPLTAVKDAVTVFLNYLRQVHTLDQAALVAYTSAAGGASIEVPLTRDTNLVENRSRHMQAGHYHHYTNIASGIESGRDELQAHGRGASLKMLVLLSDGNANWLNGMNNPAAARRATLTQARLAADDAFPIVTISLGSDSDVSLMQEVADITSGVHYHVKTDDSLEDTQAQLIEVFSAIAGHRALRLVE